MADWYYPTLESNNTGIVGTEFSNWMGGWGMMVFISMLVVFFFYAFVYMISYALNFEEMKRSAKSHLLDAIFTAILAVTIIAILGNVFTLLQQYFSGATVQCGLYGGTINLGQAGPFDFIKCKLMEKAAYISTLYERVYFSAREPFRQLALMWGLFGLPIYMQGAYIFQTSISDVYREVESYRLLAHVSVLLLISLNAYIGAVDYVAANMLSMFLPIGIVLRAIPFTRGIGAFFIAIAIGLYIVYPFLFVVTDPTFQRSDSPYVDITDSANILFPWPTFKGALAILTMPPRTQTSSFVFGSMDIREGASELAKLYYGLIIQPIVILSVTLVFVRYLTSLFGGETQELYRLATKVV